MLSLLLSSFSSSFSKRSEIFFAYICRLAFALIFCLGKPLFYRFQKGKEKAAQKKENQS